MIIDTDEIRKDLTKKEKKIKDEINNTIMPKHLLLRRIMATLVVVLSFVISVVMITSLLIFGSVFGDDMIISIVFVTAVVSITVTAASIINKNDVYIIPKQVYHLFGLNNYKKLISLNRDIETINNQRHLLDEIEDLFD